jgi:hypothetical protein
MRSEALSFMRTTSMMNVDTMVPADKVWCVLHPLPGNAAGTTSLFVKKATTTVGPSTKADFVLRHPKLTGVFSLISGSWGQKGMMGFIKPEREPPLPFWHKEKIFLLRNENGMSLYCLGLW